MPQLAIGNGPTWGAIGFVAVRAVELLLREQPSQQGAFAVACPAPAPAPAVEDWRLAVCEARLDAASSCPAPVPARRRDCCWVADHGAGAARGECRPTLLRQARGRRRCR